MRISAAARAATLLGIPILALLIAGCARKTNSTVPSGEKPFRVGMVFDVGGRGDQSFNDGAYEGMLRAGRTIPMETAEFEPGHDADREVGLRRLAEHGFDVVIGVGFLFTESIRSVAPDFPQVAFVLVDGRLENLPNVASLVFREEEGAFLVGALAAMKTKSGTLGFVGGMDVALIHKFEAGYRAGAMHVRPDVRLLVGYAGVRPDAFADPVRGKEITLAQIGQGADVIFHAAGVTGLGVIEAARDRGVYAIGVDTNQNGVAPGTVLTSMLKRVDVGVEREILAVHGKTFHGGLVELGLREEGVGYAVDENNRSLLTQEMLARAQSLADSIISGNIAVPRETGRS
ncbi:MAG TPA: BMP family ABC transporter substrate-binding protein [bacterium]|nr:BMP family ABC transporter substrate-binding protein [bacterium]